MALDLHIAHCGPARSDHRHLSVLEMFIFCWVAEEEIAGCRTVLSVLFSLDSLDLKTFFTSLKMFRVIGCNESQYHVNTNPAT